jgi:hypothetical protein
LEQIKITFIQNEDLDSFGRNFKSGKNTKKNERKISQKGTECATKRFGFILIVNVLLRKSKIRETNVTFTKPTIAKINK